MKKVIEVHIDKVIVFNENEKFMYFVSLDIKEEKEGKKHWGTRGNTSRMWENSFFLQKDFDVNDLVKKVKETIDGYVKTKVVDVFNGKNIISENFLFKVSFSEKYHIDYNFNITAEVSIRDIHNPPSVSYVYGTVDRLGRMGIKNILPMDKEEVFFFMKIFELSFIENINKLSN